jgi:hypothetical protein
MKNITPEMVAWLKYQLTQDPEDEQGRRLLPRLWPQERRP